MIKAVKILPRMAIQTLVNPGYEYYIPSVLASLPPNDGIRLVSINGCDEPFLTDDEKKTLREKYNFTYIESYRFDDIGGEIWESIVKRKNLDRSKFIYFNEEIAKNICNFCLSPYEPITHYEESNELLIVHCHAGISRSSAVGSAIAYHLGLDSDEFTTMNPNIDPNKFILSGMLSELGYSIFGFNYWRNRRNRFD